MLILTFFLVILCAEWESNEKQDNWEKSSRWNWISWGREGAESKVQKTLTFNVLEIYSKKCRDRERKETKKERSEQKKNGASKAERGGGMKQDWKNNLLGSENYFSFLGFSPWMIWFHFKGWLENTIQRYKAWVYKSIWWRTMKLSRSSLLIEKMKKNYKQKKKSAVIFLILNQS